MRKGIKMRKYKKQVKELQQSGDKALITKFLESNRGIAYTYCGILNELYNVTKDDMDREWSQELINKYNVVRRALNQMNKTRGSYIHMKTEGRVNYFWYNPLKHQDMS